MDDTQLLSQYLQGDESALTQLVQQYQKEVYGFVHRQGGGCGAQEHPSQKSHQVPRVKARPATVACLHGTFYSPVIIAPA